MIKAFKDEYSFLSNFHRKNFLLTNLICGAGKTYIAPTAEHAYQASKFMDLDLAMAILNAASPQQAKQLGQVGPLPINWQVMRVDKMMSVLTQKFMDFELAMKLVATGNQELVEGNWWHDNFWGNCTCGRRVGCRDQGENVLGRQLMTLRHSLAQRVPRDPILSLAQGKIVSRQAETPS